MAILVPLVFPAEDAFEGMLMEEFVLEQEVLKGVIGVVDIVGMFILLNAKKFIGISDPTVKTLSVGLGWGVAELLSNNVMYIVFQIWENELKPEFLYTAFSANFDLMEVLAMTALSLILTKKEEGGCKKMFIYMLVILRCLMPAILKYASQERILPCDTCVVATKASFALLFFGITQGIKG